MQMRDSKEGRLVPSKVSCCSANIPRWNSLSVKTLQKAPFLNPDPLTDWSGSENIAQVRINDRHCWVLWENGSTINAVPPEFVEASFLGCWSVEWLGWWQDGYKWLCRFILQTLGLCYHKGSGRRSTKLHQGSSGPGHTRFNSIWIPNAGYSWYTDHQLDYKCDQREWNRWVVSFLEWVKNIPLVGMPLSKTSVGNEMTANQAMDLTNLNEAVKVIKKEEMVMDPACLMA